jgi:hypothetical protein
LDLSLLTLSSGKKSRYFELIVKSIIINKNRQLPFLQLREIKNGRLAMIAASGMLLAEYASGNGVLEAWKLGAINPFN